MFDFLKRTKTATTRTDAGIGPLYFKDGAAAFGYICKYMECPLSEGSYLPALVLDSRELFGTATAVKVESDGNQMAAIRIASREGGFVVAAPTLGPKGPRLEPGQLVLWQALKFSPAFAKRTREPRVAWIGFIVGTLRPEWKDGSWLGGEKFSA
jgi:hypothetical protein